MENLTEREKTILIVLLEERMNEINQMQNSNEAKETLHEMNVLWSKLSK